MDLEGLHDGVTAFLRLDHRANELAHGLDGDALLKLLQGLLPRTAELELLEHELHLFEKSVVGIGGLVEDLADGSGKVQTGAHREGDEIDDRGEAAVDVFEALLGLPAHLEPRQRRGADAANGNHRRAHAAHRARRGAEGQPREGRENAQGDELLRGEPEVVAAERNLRVDLHVHLVRDNAADAHAEPAHERLRLAPVFALFERLLSLQPPKAEAARHAGGGAREAVDAREEGDPDGPDEGAAHEGELVHHQMSTWRILRAMAIDVIHIVPAMKEMM